MKLTPLDIKKQEFTKVMRGFDPVEVQSFLEMIAEEFETAIRAKDDLTSEVKKLKKQLDEFQDIEKTLKSTLMEAQQSTDKTKKNLEKEAEFVIKEAEIKAEQVLENARKEENRVRNEIYLLRNQRESLALRLKQLLRSQLELIKVLEIEDVKFKPEKGRKKVESKPSEPVPEEKEEETVEVIVDKAVPEIKEKKIIDPLADEKEAYEEKKSVPKIDDEINIIDKMILEEDEDEDDEDR
ncbi:DivIVA domain-containing protein [candidate division KSB1 bacterium]